MPGDGELAVGLSNVEVVGLLSEDGFSGVGSSKSGLEWVTVL